jgi:hypothetical protein
MDGSRFASCVSDSLTWPQRHDYAVGCRVSQKSEIRAKVLLGARPSTARSPAHITLTAFIFYSRSDAGSAATTQVTFTGMITSLIIHYLGWQACRRFLGALVQNGDYLLMPLRNAPPRRGVACQIGALSLRLEIRCRCQ